MASTPDTTDTLLHRLMSLASLLQTAPAGASLEPFWAALSAALDAAFSHTSCTVLTYDPVGATLQRLYSSRPDVHRPGGRKRVTDGSDWARTVLRDGQILVGSTAADIRRMFSEHETLLANGWASILNIPVRSDGQTIGSINIMNGEHAYDAADQAVARLFAQICVPAVQRAERESQAAAGNDADEKLEYV